MPIGDLDMQSKRRLPLTRDQARKKTMQGRLVPQARRNKSGCTTQNRRKMLAQSFHDRTMHQTPQTRSDKAPGIAVARALKLRIKVTGLVQAMGLLYTMVTGCSLSLSLAIPRSSALMKSRASTSSSSFSVSSSLARCSSTFSTSTMKGAAPL